MGSADFQKASNKHAAYHVQWFHRFHESHGKKTLIFFEKNMKLHTGYVFLTEECGKLHKVADRFRHTTDFAVVKVFSSNILSLEFASHAYRGHGDRIYCQRFHLVQQSQVWKPDGVNVLCS